MTVRRFAGIAVLLGVVFGPAYLARAYAPSYASTMFAPAASQTLSWPAGATINYRHWVGNSTAANVSGGGADAAMDAAFVTVEGATGLNFVNLGTQMSGDAGLSSNGANLVTFQSTANNATIVGGALAVAAYYYNTSTFVITEADVVFNASVAFTTNGTSTDYDVQSVGTHECGHVAGLDHCPMCDSTMFPFGFPGQETSRTLAHDDRAGLRQLYPTAPSEFLLGYGTVTGTVQTGPGSGVAGAHVFLTDAIRGTAGPSAVSKPNGTFTIAGVRAGLYRVNVEPINGPMTTADLGAAGWTGTSFNTTFQSTRVGGSSTPSTISVRQGLTTALGAITVSATAATLNPTAMFPMATATGGFSFQGGESIELPPGYAQWIGVVGSGFNALADAAFSFDTPFITITGPSTQSGVAGGGYKIFPIAIAAETPPGGYTLIVSNGGEIAFGPGMVTVTDPASPPAFARAFGVSCPSAGAIALAGVGAPSVGNMSFKLRSTGTTAGRDSFFLMALGPDAVTVTGNFGAAGSCPLYLDLSRLLFPYPGFMTASVTTMTDMALPIPNNPALSGFDVYAQAAEFNAGTGAVKLTNGLLLALR